MFQAMGDEPLQHPFDPGAVSGDEFKDVGVTPGMWSFSGHQPQ